MKVWAHRGCSYRYPENTLSSFRAACEYEITGIELDIQLSKDGELVVIHDESVERTTDGVGNVRDMTLMELKKLKIISISESGILYESIPTMRDVLEVLQPECLNNGLLINVELKNSIVKYEGMEQKIIDMVKAFGLEQYVIYSSFNPESLSLLRTLEPNVKLGILSPSLKECYDISGDLNVNALHPYIKQIDMENVSELTDLPIRAWNIRADEPFFPEDRPCEIQNLDELGHKGITDIFTNAPEYYVPKRNLEKNASLTFKIAKGINAENGYIESTTADYIATEHFTFAKQGSVVRWKNKEYCYQVFRYSLETEPHLIYSYCYQKEENWATYMPEKSSSDWETKDILFADSCYFRLVIKRCDGEGIESLPDVDEMLEFYSVKQIPYIWPEYFRKEADMTVETVKEWRKGGDLSFILLTDSHYVNNGTWEDTAYNIARVAERVKPDAVVHLGDVTDGMVSRDVLETYAGKTINDLKETGKPVYLCLGNHDSNYFCGNPERLTEEEMSRFYLEQEKPYYYVDYKEQKLRVLFLHSFDYREAVRYGFPEEELEWVKQVLGEMESGWDVIVFAHVPPLPVIHFWSDQIRNGEELIQILEEFHAKKEQKVLAYIHGHNHAEQVYTERAFPIIGIGCNKLEDFKDRKPEGSVTYDRKRNTVTQDLWDVLIVSHKKDKLKFVRFGAGEDRIVEC